MSNIIQYLKNKNINKGKWDACIQASSNGLIYGLSNYLDVVADNWDGLILGDYDAVMPLPWKRKFGIKIIYHPFFCQQLGIFCTDNSKCNIQDFIAAIPKSFLRVEVSTNAKISSTFHDKYLRPNYLLPLNKPYADIRKGFNTNTKRNIKKSQNRITSPFETVDVQEFLKLKEDNPVNNLNGGHFILLEKLFNYLTNNKLGEIFGVRNPQGELMAAAFFTRYKKRSIYLFSVSTKEGKENSAMFKIIDHVIQTNQNSELVIDFEGSVIPGVAGFFKGFGAQAEYYARFTLNLNRKLRL